MVRLSVNDADLMSLPVPVPEGASSLSEQQKIAECLTSLKELIAAQGRKVAALAAHKRALMQQLFPAKVKPSPGSAFLNFGPARSGKSSR